MSNVEAPDPCKPSARGKKSLLQKLALSLGATLVAFVCVEIVLRALGDDIPALGNQYVFYQFDPQLGWKNAPGQAGTYTRVEFSYSVSNNRLGMRDAEIGPKTPDEIRVAVLGDSFTWGIGAAYGQRYTEIVEKRDPAFNVLNFGVSGYGTVQQLLQLDTVLEQHPDFVVVAFCLGNDVLDNVYPFRYNYRKPTASLTADGGIQISAGPLYQSRQFGGPLVGATSRLRIAGLIRQALRQRSESKWRQEHGGESKFSIADADLYLPDAELSPEFRKEKREAFEITLALLREMKAKVTAALGSGRFAVLFVPTKFEAGIAKQAKPGSKPNLVGDDLRSRLAAEDAPVIDGRSVIGAAEFWTKDGHWNLVGHEKIGILLTDELEKRFAPERSRREARQIKTGKGEISGASAK